MKMTMMRTIPRNPTPHLRKMMTYFFYFNTFLVLLCTTYQNYYVCCTFWMFFLKYFVFWCRFCEKLGWWSGWRNSESSDRRWNSGTSEDGYRRNHSKSLWKHFQNIQNYLFLLENNHFWIEFIEKLKFLVSMKFMNSRRARNQMLLWKFCNPHFKPQIHI